MKFNYRVKHNGVVYPAGADVPVGNVPAKPEVKPEAKLEVKAEEKTPQTYKKATPKRKAKK